MLYDAPPQIAGKPHINHPTTISNNVDVEHLFNISTHQLISLNPHHVISTEGGALCRRSGEICCCFLPSHHTNLNRRPSTASLRLRLHRTNPRQNR
jgi:hypothetical protein